MTDEKLPRSVVARLVGVAHDRWLIGRSRLLRAVGFNRASDRLLNLARRLDSWTQY